MSLIDKIEPQRTDASIGQDGDKSSTSNDNSTPLTDSSLSTSMKSELPGTSKSTSSNETILIQNFSSWLQTSSNDFVTKGQAVLDSIKNSTNLDDIAKKYEEFVSFVHGSVAEIKKYIDIKDIESKLTKVECNQIRYNEQLNYLTSQCSGWWAFSRDLCCEPPRTYKDHNPWFGMKDKRNAAQYVEEFIDLVLPYCHGQEYAKDTFTDYLLIDSSDGGQFFIDRQITFQQGVKNFIERFCTDDVFYREFASFQAASPVDPGYYDFALFWLNKFRFNPLADPCWVLNNLFEKFPDRYKSPLNKLKTNSDVSYDSILKTIYDVAAKSKDPVPETCKYLGYRVIRNLRGAPSNGHYVPVEVEPEVRKSKPKSKKKKVPKTAEEKALEKQMFRMLYGGSTPEEDRIVAELLKFRMLPFSEALEKSKEWGYGS